MQSKEQGMWPFGWIGVILLGAVITPLTQGLGAILGVAGLCGFSIYPGEPSVQSDSTEAQIIPEESYNEVREIVFRDEIGRTVGFRQTILKIERKS